MTIFSFRDTLQIFYPKKKKKNKLVSSVTGELILDNFCSDIATIYYPRQKLQIENNTTRHPDNTSECHDCQVSPNTEPGGSGEFYECQLFFFQVHKLKPKQTPKSETPTQKIDLRRQQTCISVLF